jgi:hypothetical protein
MDEEKIRAELSKILVENPNDYSKILELSSKLASFDTDNVRFSVDAGVIDRLGTELVAREETAVSELVKNAYDADAKKVTLKFENSESTGGTLFIEDDGIALMRLELLQKERLINNGIKKESSQKM